MSVREDLTTAAGHLAGLRRAVAARHGSLGAPGEVVFIPDEDYDPAIWKDADDELGPHRGLSRG